MESGKESVKQLETKIEKLISLHQSALKEINSLKKENKFLTEELAQEKERVRDLQNRESTSKLIETTSLRSEAESEDLKKTVQGLIREVDECIALLNK